MKNLFNLVIAVLVMLATYYIAPIFIVVMLIRCLYGCVKMNSLDYVTVWFVSMKSIITAWIKTVEMIAKNGNIIEAVMWFRKRVGSH